MHSGFDVAAIPSIGERNRATTPSMIIDRASLHAIVNFHGCDRGADVCGRFGVK